MGRTAREGKPLYAKSLVGHAQIFFCIFDIKIWITQKMVCNSTQKSLKRGYARFRARLTLKMGQIGLEGQQAA